MAAAGTASATPVPVASSIPVGQGYMGAGYAQDNKDFKPVTGQLQLNTPGTVTPDAANPPGIDVSHYQGSINWSSVKAAGIQFAYIKATESTTYKDPDFSANYLNAYNAKVIRGAYHFAHPDLSSGAAQATYFAANGGAWSADNLTLPGMLDLEGGCYGLSAASMQSWILDFYNTYKAKTGRDIVIYTSPSWWNSCTGGWSGMSTRSPLFVADWTTAASPVIPGGFPYATLWQYADNGSVSGISGAVDRDYFIGTSARLLALANNTP
ncbi:GH25 family lysozyme [Streptomyces sp. SL13]|uniref:Lysozyme n=1 Tax=Streptantibioticus silvisoli TaxID=2705255 RepID=A0AA90K9C4_9ACTN|nr:GH25 family lysozyme [Streptantibioticus silvisoli]MDI5962278.1 GH25 family lysozyme [Streptantibioticus silvisoli]MDI5970707.1 GH25 family lysozyme [Streptantibioticus silvisoli]